MFARRFGRIAIQEGIEFRGPSPKLRTRLDGPFVFERRLAHFATYSSAKSGLRAFSEALRRELAGTQVGVTYLAPRAIKTGMLTPAIRNYAKLVGMNIDNPERIAARIARAIKEREKDVYIGFPEQLFVRVNAVLPRLIDAAVAAGDRKAAKLFRL